jgi:hypothetical protein
LAKLHALTAAAAEAAGLSAATAAQQENVQPEPESSAAATAAADANGQCSDDQHVGLEAVSGFVDAQQQAALDASTTAAAAVQLLREDSTQQQQQQGEEADEASSSHPPYQPDYSPHQQEQQQQQAGLSEQQQQYLQEQEEVVSSPGTAHAAAAAGGAWAEAPADDAHWAEPLVATRSATLSDLPISGESSAISAAADDLPHQQQQQQQREWVPWGEFVEVREKLRSKLERGKAQFDELKGLHRKGKAEARGLREQVSQHSHSLHVVLRLCCICAKRAYCVTIFWFGNLKGFVVGSLMS